MKRAVPTRHRDLFESEAVARLLASEQRAALLPLLMTLLVETLADDAALVEERADGQSHA